jgi:hypothetical protein
LYNVTGKRRRELGKVSGGRERKSNVFSIGEKNIIQRQGRRRIEMATQKV